MIVEKIRATVHHPNDLDKIKTLNIEHKGNHELVIKFWTGEDHETVEFYMGDDGALRMSFQTPQNNDDNAPRYNVPLTIAKEQ